MGSERVAGVGSVSLAALLAASGCSAIETALEPFGTTEQSAVHVQGDVLVGALGELKDYADVGYGATLRYAKPLQTLEDGAVMQLELLGSYAKQDFSWSETYFDPFSGFTVTDYFSDSADVFRLGGGLRFELPTDAPLIPYLDVGLAYHSYSVDDGSTSGPGGYVGAGLDVALGDGFTVGVDSRLHVVALSGDLKGMGIVPTLGLSLGCRF